MLEKARASGLKAEWSMSDIRDWCPTQKFDLVFSNAALQWVPDHAKEVTRLFGCVAPGGAFAAQIPSGHGPWVEVIREMVGSPNWAARYSRNLVDLGTEELAFYYDLLSPSAERVDLWETVYVHVMGGPEAVVEWTRGSALRPLLEALGDEKERFSFLADYSAKIAERYPRRPDGRVLFPFRRKFWVAYRSAD